MQPWIIPGKEPLVKTQRTFVISRGGRFSGSGLRVLIFLVPGHLNRFKDIFVRFFGIVREVGKRDDPGVHVGESNGERVRLRMFFD